MKDRSIKKLAKIVMASFCALLMTWMPYWSPTAAADKVASAEPKIEFTGDFQENLTGELVQGGKFKVNYDSNRLTCARASKYGGESWSILGYVQYVKDGESSYQALMTPGKDVILTSVYEIPSDAQEVTMWFYNNDIVGNKCYDSDYGANYHFSVASNPIQGEIDFTKDYQEIVKGELVPGGKFKVNYDSDRLTCARGYKYGQPAWSILGYVQYVKDGESSYQALMTPGKNVILTSVYEIPSDAQEVTMWFQNNDVAGYNCYDSDYSANYHFPLTK